MFFVLFVMQKPHTIRYRYKNSNKKRIQGIFGNFCFAVSLLLRTKDCPKQKRVIFAVYVVQLKNYGEMEIFIGLTIPLLGTVLGAALVFMLREKISGLLNKAMLGFASGVMVAASFWSLLQPALEQVGEGLSNTWPILAGFAAGICFLLFLDCVIPHQHVDEKASEGPKSKLPRSIKMILAVALHNIPEGMAVGVVFAGVMNGDTNLTVAGALALSIGMAIQNIPEGAIISVPLRSEGKSRSSAFTWGALSGLVEPAAAIATIFFLGNSEGAMPLLLAFAAGAMLYVVVEELIPSSQAGQHSNVGTIGFAIGFALMMTLDSALG
jgi:ZIP family zinc transporter